MIKKIKRIIRDLWIGLILGMKKTEDETFHQNGTALDNESTVNQKVSEHSVAKALLRGELTQEVIDLRYRTYAVARESEHYNYFSPTLATKKNGQDSKFVYVENEDNREIVTIQENKVEVETVTEALERLGENTTYTDRQNEYNIMMKRHNFPRFKLEEFTTKLVVKKGDDEWSAVLDVYVSKYPNDKNMKSKPFIRELERIIDTGVRSDIFEIDTISFETRHAYKLDDMLRFEFGDLKLERIFEFDGDYVIRFITNIIDGGTDLTAEFYSERMAKKYANHEKKELEINFDPEANIRVYKCAECGKEVTYDARALDNMEVKSLEQIETESEGYDGKTTEYLDFEMSEHEFGRMLCKDCVTKAMQKLYKEWAVKKD